MTRAAALACALACACACGPAGREAPDGATVPDLAAPQVDFAADLRADLLEAPDLVTAADLATSPDLVGPADMTDPPDLTPACGGDQQPCCSGGICTGSARCMRLTDLCTGPTRCITPRSSCGGPGLTCCGTTGNPQSIGYCRASDSLCMLGTCRPATCP